MTNTDTHTSGDAGGPRLSIVVPAYNEEGRIGDTLPVIWEYAHERYESFELIVVDDGSNDATASIVTSFAESHPEVRLISYSPNQGKGCAVRTGMLEARGELVLFCDADLATPMEEAARLKARISGKCQVAIGSRAVRGAELVVRQPLYREFAGRTFNLMVRLLAVPGIHDTQCGFKMFTQSAAKQIFSRCRENGFAFDIEVLHVARRLGYGVVEVPVHWRHVAGSKVRLLRDAVRMFLALLRITLRHRGVRREENEPC